MKHIIEILAAASLFLLSSGCSQASETDLPAETSEINNAAIYYEIFSGLPKSEIKLSTVNCKDFRPSLLCYGDGNTFFMWNGAVYRYNGEVAERLFERNAYNLCYNSGKLYFIENDSYKIGGNDLVHIEGILYSYELEEKVFNALTDYPVSMPIVSGDEIFYTDYAAADDPIPPTGVCRIDENGTSERLYDGVKYTAYGEYRLKYDWSGDEKVFFAKNNKALLLENIHPYWDCIDGDYYYYRSQTDGTLNRLSLLTGEAAALKPYESYHDDSHFEDEEKFICLDYTVLNDEIYFIDDCSSLRKYDEKSDNCIQIDCEYAFRYIYADDKNIYGVGCEREEESLEHTFYFIKLTLNKNIAKGEILA
ncbi:MAG TPA: hypothetical protein DDX91_07855 [Ruminococcaceae bacterium]|nr:hypothetical protein [Oscillospiraceae bacterium]